MKSAVKIPIVAILSALAVFVGLIPTASAGHHGDSMFSSNLSDMDSNNDGVVTFEEYSDYHSERIRWSFDALDTDNDGSINIDEWETFLKMHGAHKS